MEVQTRNPVDVAFLVSLFAPCVLRRFGTGFSLFSLSLYLDFCPPCDTNTCSLRRPRPCAARRLWRCILAAKVPIGTLWTDFQYRSSLSLSLSFSYLTPHPYPSPSLSSLRWLAVRHDLYAPFIRERKDFPQRLASAPLQAAHVWNYWSAVTGKQCRAYRPLWTVRPEERERERENLQALHR